MAATNNQKLKLLYILKFLQENTDENHIAHAEDIKLYLLNHATPDGSAAPARPDRRPMPAF